MPFDRVHFSAFINFPKIASTQHSSTNILCLVPIIVAFFPCLVRLQSITVSRHPEPTELENRNQQQSVEERKAPQLSSRSDLYKTSHYQSFAPTGSSWTYDHHIYLYPYDMHGRYEVADLLKLRQSPLVARPKGLPPVEEWMGVTESKRPTPSRGKFEEQSTQTESFQKRPTLLDAASRRSTTDAGGIHLGPPRNSFASSNATRNRNGTHERTKTNEEIDSRFGDRRSGNFGTLNGKFGAKADTENDSIERPRRRIDTDENEPRPRKEYDRPKWSSRDNQADGERSDDPGQRNIREGHPREKFSQPWVRKEKPTDQDDTRRDTWRRGQRERDNERQDAEPEWVDAIETPEPMRQHTHEDFLRWKESMTGRAPGDTKSMSVEDTQEKPVETGIPSQTRIVSDPIASGDKFFAKFEENKSSTRPTKSRFANIFSPKEQPKPDAESPVSTLIPVPAPAELEQPPPSAEPEKKVDADFAKLLAMLSKNESSSAASKTRPPRSPLNVAELSSARSPDMTANTAIPTQSTRTPVATHNSQLSLDRLIESRSPAHHEQTMQAKPGAQELLELLQRSNLQDRQEQRPPSYLQQDPRVVGPPPGLAGYHDRDRSGPGPPLISTRRETSRSIFDDPAFTGYRGEPQQYRPQHVASPSDHGGLENLIAAMNKSYLPNNLPDQRAAPTQQAPPGLQRPPGLDSRPPPGWSGNPPQPQRQPSQHIQAYNLGPQQSLFTNPNPAAYAQQQQREPQRPLQRKPTGEMGGYASYPPPGFGPSPPYASPTSPDQYGPMRNDFGISERIANRERLERQPQPPPPQQQNSFAAMYGNVNNGRGGGGGVQLPPGFR